jgi:hypothetical protein
MLEEEAKKKTEEIFKDVYDILVDDGGAARSDAMRSSFMLYHCEHHWPGTMQAFTTTEWRIMGHFGMGGKFWVNTDDFHVNCYSEDWTEDKAKLIKSMNEKLKPLYLKLCKLQEEYLGKEEP